MGSTADRQTRGMVHYRSPSKVLLVNPLSSSRYDAIIIGGGPAGLSAATLLGRACRRVAVIDAREPRNAVAREIHGLLGRDSTTPQELLRDARADLAKYDVEILDDTVTSTIAGPTSADADFPTSFVVTTAGGRSLMGRKLLFATGIRDELPDLPGLRACYGASIHHCPYCDGWEHRGEKLIAYGEQASGAIGLGMMLRGWSEQVTVLTHGQSATDDQKRRLAANGIALIEDRIDRLLHDGDQLQGVQFRSREAIAADALFFNSGERPASTLPLSLGCELREDASTPTDPKQRTSAPGVFLAGDAAGEVEFVVVAAAEGATAAVAINRQLQDEDRFRAEAASANAGGARPSRLVNPHKSSR